MTILAQARSVFYPQMRIIIGITNANPCVITTSIDGVNPANHNYKNGLIIRTDIPVGFGMPQINQQSGAVTVLTPTTFSIPINTLFYDPFVLPPTGPSGFPVNVQAAQSVPFGEVSSTFINATVNTLNPS